ncbi:MAG TPA: type II secretion system secretin GspD [Desulfatiglandales bacterium]|nr:type II secretion system secretin GspD [Desulfatiglandales bacterium]
MRYKKRIYLFSMLFLLLTYCFTAGDVSGARLSGDNEVTSAAPESVVPSVAAPENTPTAESEPEGMTGMGNGPLDNPPAGDNRDSSARNVAKTVGRARENYEQGDYITIYFNNVDILEFIKYISELTGKNFLVDSNVKGKITILSPTKITIKEAYKVFESVLEVNGFTIVESDAITKIVSMTEARSKDIETGLLKEPVDSEDKLVTQLIPLKYANPEEIQKVLSGLISKNSLIVSYAPTGMLIITDVLSNIKRLLEIVDALDVEGTSEVISLIPLEHAGAESMAKSLTSIFKTTTSRSAKDASASIVIVSDARTNSIITLASEVDTLRIKGLINLLDKEAPKGEGDIHVYYLQNANAEDLAKVLTAIPKEKTTTTAAASAETTVVLSKDVQIIADKATNSIIIMANKDDYLVLEDIIQKLDIPRKMVYIEALIMEVSMTKQLELGVQWYGGKPAGELAGNDIGIFSGSNPGDTGILPSVDANTSLVTLPTGFSLGVLGDTITIGGLTFPSIAAVVRAYATNSDVHILSTPQVIALDNEEAEIKVVDNVPFITRRDTTSSSDIAYSNYEFKDVGVILNITPQINQERFVRLKISQEVSQVVKQGKTEGLPTTLKREAKTTVVIKDGQTIVIGGLIDETGNRTSYKTPLLGDIPIIGNLFRSRTAKLDKKNLYIFLTPHIIENPEEARELYENKKSNIDAVQEGAISMNRGRSSQTRDDRLVDLGYGYIQTKDYDKAAEYFEKALKINTDNPYALLNMGFIYQEKKDKQRAIEMYERLISLDSDERAYVSTEPAQAGRRLSDIARDNLKNLKDSQ